MWCHEGERKTRTKLEANKNPAPNAQGANKVLAIHAVAVQLFMRWGVIHTAANHTKNENASPGRHGASAKSIICKKDQHTRKGTQTLRKIPKGY